MPDIASNRYLKWTWCIVSLSFLFRFFYAQAFLLAPDETNYWQWARHLAWGYHDQAPLIAWAIKGGTILFGHTALAVRLPSIAAMTIASVYIWLIGRRWFSSYIGFHAVALSQTVFVFYVGGVLATADGLQGAAWAAASYHAGRAVEHNQWRQWILGGLWFGIGMLSKYTMVLFLPCVFLFLLFSPVHRRMLLTLKPYAACAIGLSLFSPVIAWNAANDWNSVRHVAYIGGANESFTLNLAFLGDYMASQAALISPFVFILILGAWYRIARRHWFRGQWVLVYLFFTSFPVVFGFAGLSLHTRVYGNWPCAGYMTAIVLAAVVWLGGREKARSGGGVQRPGGFWRFSVISSLALTLVVLVQVVWPVFPIPVKLDRAADEVVGWDQLGQRVGALRQQMPDPDNTFVFGLRYQIASELAFYTPGQPETVSINRWDRPNVYDYWQRDEALIGSNAVGAMRDANAAQRLSAVFERVDPPVALPIDRVSKWPFWKKGSETIKTFHIYKCYGFKGGSRWVPEQLKDIRRGASLEK